MNELTLVTIFSILFTWLVSLTVLVFSIKNESKKTRLAVELFVNGMGKGAAIVLHSPDDHLGIDKLLEEYIKNHHDLSFSSWVKMAKVCKKLQEDNSIPDNKKIAACTLLAAFNSQLSLHKLRISLRDMEDLMNKNE